MGLLDRLTTMGVDSVTGLGDHLQDTEKLGQIGLSPENYNVISAMNAADNMDAGLGSLMAPGALYSMGDTMFNPNQSIPEGINDFGRYMKGVNIQSNPELAKQLMGQNYVNQMQGKYALAMDEIGKGIFGKGPNPDLYNQQKATNIGNAPSIFDINEVGDPALNPGSINATGIDPYGVATTGRPTMADIAGLGDLGNPTGDSRVVSEEMGMTGTPNFGRPSMADIAGQINENPDYGQFFDAPAVNEEKRNVLSDLLGIASLAYTGPYKGLVKGANLMNNIRTGKAGKIANSVRSGLGSLGNKLGSLGNKFAGAMRGINPTTGRSNTQAQYEQDRADRKQQSRIDYVADRLAKGKKTLSDPYSIAKTAAQRQQIRDGRIKGAEKKAAKDPYSGYGSCFIAGTKVSMADGTFKNIEYVKVGDKIKGHKEDNTVIKLDPTSLGDRKLYSFNNNQHYFFTSEHPFMTEEGWKSIKPEKTKERDGVELYEQLKGELKVGDKLVTDNGLVEITNIDSKEMNSPEMSLYNFNVSNDNSYIADGYIVHNKGGGGGKIVCTMMNERYGFGSFRNKIWMKFHESHGPEYQKGYHAIFLPLVKIAKGEGKINTAVRKVLEHMGRHVTADMFKIMKGKKRDTLGRIYRAIFEPACHIIGKIKSALGRG